MQIPQFLPWNLLVEEGKKWGKKKDFQDVLSVLSNEQNTQDMETSQSFIPSTDLQS